MARAGYTDWIWIPALRVCRVSEDRVEITPPLIFGRSFAFDWSPGVVKIRRCLLGVTISTEEFPLEGVKVSLRRTPATGSGCFWPTIRSPSPEVGEGAAGISTFIIDVVAGRRRFIIGGFGDRKRRVDRVLAAIQRVTSPARKYE